MSSADLLRPEDALEHILHTARTLGAAQADAVYAEDESLSVEVFEAEPRNLERSDSAGLGIRVFVDGCPGYSFTERLTREAVERCARDACALATLTDPLALVLPQANEVEERDLGLWDAQAASWTPEQMLAVCREAESAGLAADARIVNVPHLGATRSASRLLLANTNGVRGSRQSASVSFGIGVVARKNEVSKMGYEGITWRTPAPLDVRAMALESVERAVSLLDAAPAPAGDLPVLFDNRVAGGFLSLFWGSLLADSVQKGQSRFAGRIGQKVAANGFHLSTEPFMPGMGSSRLRDGEGIATAPRRLIDDGVLTGFLHNLETATREGIAPTGDASRSYAGRVGAGFSNTVVSLEGGQDLSQLMNAFPRILYVTKLEGSTGCNGVSGDISVGIQGYLIENGQIVQPVDRTTLSGNFFEILPQMIGWGNQYRPGVQSTLVPALLFPSLSVAS